MTSQEEIRHRLTVIDGPRTCPSGKNKNKEQYLIQWTELTSKGNLYKPEWLNTEDIGEADLDAYIYSDDDGEDASDDDPMDIDQPTSCQEDLDDDPMDIDQPTPCQDTSEVWPLRLANHNQDTLPCKSGKHVTPYYVCKGCEGVDLDNCCAPAVKDHIYRDEGCHTICSECANGLFEAEGLVPGFVSYNICQCQQNEHSCVQCHVDGYNERYNRKLGGAGFCFCGNPVDQTTARACSGCGFLVTKQAWN